MIESGRLKHRVAILERVATEDPIYGTMTYSWVTKATVWAEVQDVLPSRGERIAEGISIASRPCRVRMRYRDDVDTTMRLSFEGRTLNIIAGPAELGFREGVEFMAEQLSTLGE